MEGSGGRVRSLGEVQLGMYGDEGVWEEKGNKMLLILYLLYFVLSAQDNKPLLDKYNKPLLDKYRIRVFSFIGERDDEQLRYFNMFMLLFVIEREQLLLLFSTDISVRS